MFFGESIHPVDDKGRVFVPKRFQEVLDRVDEGRPMVVLTRGFEGCLFVFSKSGFQEVLARLRTQAFGGAELRRIQRLFFTKVARVQLDAAGRVVLPENLRAFAGIDKKSEAVMVGVADRAEIWSRAAWEAFQAEGEDDFDSLDHVLCGDGVAPTEGA